ncbi:hypothetical protein GCM10017709_34220 [Glutamicibacter nicotianae]|uniref:Uncharacterized protein n=1 Tax=Glutamicibacter nicotianae TaxID=37929 RepID=A0ABQ0RHB5_GLUNI|nr:hypothetical protein ANI01nite_04020 [Glutamicibacter nicotianae]
MLTMMVAAALPTSKLTAYCGKIGAMSPKPKAMMKAATSNTPISEGIGGLEKRVVFNAISIGEMVLPASGQQPSAFLERRAGQISPPASLALDAKYIFAGAECHMIPKSLEI